MARPVVYARGVIGRQAADISAAGRPFAGQRAAITGARGAIGAAVARALAAAGAELTLIGRDAPALAALADELAPGAPAAQAVCPIDLADGDGLEAAAAALAAALPRLDLFVHCAGVLEPATLAETTLAAWDRQFAVNVRAPFVLVRALLPRLLASAGQIALVNSSVARQPPRVGLGAYTASKFALRALTDTLRAEVSGHGVRVVAIYPGRTRGRMQIAMHTAEGRPYRPDALLPPEDVAGALLAALALPRTAEVTELSIRPARRLDGP